MKYALAAALALIAVPVLAETGATADQITQINALLASMTCEVDPDNIDVEAAGGFDLDDVLCADGQYDMKLDAALAVLEQRKE